MKLIDREYNAQQDKYMNTWLADNATEVTTDHDPNGAVGSTVIVIENKCVYIKNNAGKWQKFDMAVNGGEGGGEEEVNLAKGIIERTITEISDDTVEQIGEYAFYVCQKLSSVNLPKVVYINARAFYKCKLDSVYLPKVKQIYSSAFGYSQIKTVDFPSATNFYANAFETCRSLTSVILPSVKTIGNNTFYYCDKLQSVRLPATPPTLSNTNAFSYINAACVFYIPTGSLAAYQAATNWSALTSQYTFTEEDR